jgi:phosphatidylglycerol:prolipoprotein diacylglycerol transferase
MYPDLFRLNLPLVGAFTVSSYGVMLMLAFLVSGWVVAIRLRETGRDPSLAWDIVVAGAIGGIAGGKLYYMLLNWKETLAHPLGMLFSRSGLVWYGGLVGGAAAAIWLLHRRGVRLAPTLDAAAPALALGYGIGRIGCFLVGDDYGQPTTSPLGIAFPQGSPPTTAGNLRHDFGLHIPPGVPDGQVLRVWPTELFETAAALVIFALLWRLRRRPAHDGWLFGVWMVAAGVERFLIEFLRAKDDRFLGPFTIAQVLSAALIVAGIAVVRARRRADAVAE